MSVIRGLSRNEAILLGICTILAVILAVGQAEDFTINARLNAQVTDLQNQVDDLTNIVNFRKYADWAIYQTINQPANSCNSWTNYAEYAGYVEVQVLSSTTDKLMLK